MNLIDRKLLAAALEDKSILFLKNHGVVVAAASLEAATTLTMDVEMMARVHLESKPAGGSPISDMDHIAEVQAGARKNTGSLRRGRLGCVDLHARTTSCFAS
jgi:ribulose-5-phosphate 4-epimerase/fuculose-1-phosphate aldolase